ncbi:MAG: hypothetical protein H0X02_04565 [Nitrosomonas sp.]|nr:hypothetical protein [Nitrosomonas sp.]
MKESKEVKEAKEYVAVKRGYDGVKVREVGEVFMFSGIPGKWMKLHDAKAPVVHAAPKEEKSFKKGHSSDVI